MSKVLNLIRRHPLLVLILILLISRIINLTLLPIFSDEANYLEWGWREIHDPGQAFLSLYDAKQPFLMWLFGIAQTISPGDPLWASRFISVLTGVLNLTGLYLIAKKISSSSVAIISGIIYILCPFFVFFDRQALMESSLAAVFIWSFYFFLRFVQKPHFLYPSLIGIILGIGFLIKSTAALFLVTFIISSSYFAAKNHDRLYSLLSQILLGISCFLIVSLPLFFQSSFWTSLGTNDRYSMTFSQLIKFPLVTWGTNLLRNLEILFTNFTPLIFIAVVLGVYRYIKSRNASYLYLLVWTAVSLISYVFILRHTSSLSFRYLTPLIPLLIIPAAEMFKSKKLLLTLSLLPALVAYLILVFSPAQYFFIKDRLTRFSYLEGYITAPGSGYQVNALRNYFEGKAEKENIYVGVEIAAFNPTAAIYVYYRKNPHIIPAALDTSLFPEDLVGESDCISTDRPLYFLSTDQRKPTLFKFLEYVDTVSNPYSSETNEIYTLKSGCLGKTFRIYPSFEN